MITAASILVTFVLFAVSIPVGVAVAVFSTEILSAILNAPARAKPTSSSARRPRVAALVPAHNEGSGLLSTLSDILGQLAPPDRLLVVADNCTDDTASIAATSGAEVLQRCDPVRHGKGYALDAGIAHLSLDPPEVVIIIDADCRLSAGLIERLASKCAETKKPIQGFTRMKSPKGSSVNHQVAEFAWLVKNYVRPNGLKALGLPCQLMGTGMALPWDVIRDADLATGELVEDLKLGLDLAAAGHPPVFCPSAVMHSHFPSSAAAAVGQRQRWEYGHIRMLLHAGPRHFLRAIRDRNLPLLVLALDLAVPPIALLVLLAIASIFLSGCAYVIGLSLIPFFVSALTGGILFAALASSWWRFGRDLLPVHTLWLVPRYVLQKMAMYCGLIIRQQVRWMRTDRSE